MTSGSSLGVGGFAPVRDDAGRATGRRLVVTRIHHHEGNRHDHHHRHPTRHLPRRRCRHRPRLRPRRRGRHRRSAPTTGARSPSSGAPSPSPPCWCSASSCPRRFARRAPAAPHSASPSPRWCCCSRRSGRVCRSCSAWPGSSSGTPAEGAVRLRQVHRRRRPGHTGSGGLPRDLHLRRDERRGWLPAVELTLGDFVGSRLDADLTDLREWRLGAVAGRDSPTQLATRRRSTESR